MKNDMSILSPSLFLPSFLNPIGFDDNFKTDYLISSSATS